MVAHTRLWIDDDGKLTDAPPSRGVLIARNGGDIPERFIKTYHLSLFEGRVVQNGKPAKTPKSTPDALIADRALWVTKDGVVVDEKPAPDAVQIATAGEKIPRGYQVAHKLVIHEGRVVQKQAPKPVNKMAKAATTK